MLVRALISVPTLVIALAAIGGPQGIMYRCAMDGEVRPSCCCEHDKGEPVHEMRAARSSCCDIEEARWDRIPPLVKGDRVVDVEASSLCVAPLSSLCAAPASRNTAVAAGARASPYRGPPLYIAICSYLI